ncbi:MAG TPA: hypothetical protein VM600_04575 [Actinomycetota bacterium]|nr:hypothetical protein [Actinomycetota bacterium]
MPKRTGEDTFQALLEGPDTSASTEVKRLVSIAKALEATPRRAARPEFRASLRAQLIARASASPEETFDTLLASRAMEDAEFAPLVKIAAALETGAVRAEPSPQFRYGLRNRLVADLARPRGLAAAASAVDRRWRRSLRRVVATGMAAAMMLGGSTAMAASDGALPGDAVTYDLKLMREDAQVWILRGSSEGTRLLELAARRVGELRGLADRAEARVPLFTGTLERMDRQTLTGSEILIKEGSADLLKRVDRFAEAQAADLVALVDRMPPGARPAARDSIAIVEKVERLAEDKLRGCPCAEDTTNPLEHFNSPAPADTCPCAGPVSSGSSDSAAGAGDTGGNRGDQPDGGRGDGSDGEEPPGPQDTRDPTVDVPDLPQDTDEKIEKIIDDLLGISPPPASTPQLPALGGTTPAVPAVKVPVAGL